MIDELVAVLERENVEWELYWEIGRGSSFRIERESLERSQRKFYSGIGLRIGYKGREGFSYITGINHDRKTLEDFVNKTVKLARVSEVPSRGFPEPGRPADVKDLYDRRIEEMPFEDAHSLAVGFAKTMGELKGEAILSGSLSFGVSRYGVVNSNGVELEGRSTGMGVSVYAVLGRGTGSYYQTYRSLQPLDELEKGIHEALNDAELSARARPIGSHSGEVLLEPEAFQAILSIFLENLFGDSVYFRRSRFSSLGREVGGECLTILDDATLPGGSGSYPFDGEGVPGQRTVLVENGVLRSFLLDFTYASFLGMESTGNAVRDFRTKPHIGTSNLVVEPGKESLGGFDGVVVKEVFGEHTANPVSGDFSLTIGLGYVVKNGEVKPFRDNMLSGNVFGLLKSVEAVGREQRRRGSFVSPRVLAEARVV
ncbi:TldD/PmbA family protein [Thermococcus sp.]|uniref:TldD/PmbA family protein n=1 Tax=Thermococcus sp. TaxID=35749 RepID=UPI00261687FD|nr:TldD/PmbA family protein [Thermococcus sp.]